MATVPTTQVLNPPVGADKATRAKPFSISYGIWFAALIAYCVIGTGFVGSFGARMIKNSWENTFPEGPHVYTAIRTARTGQLYYPYTQTPYVIQSFGPLYYVISAATAWAAHLDVRGTILDSRWICYISYLLCGIFVFAICRKVRASLVLSFLASLMMLGHPDFLGWNVTVRPDMLLLLAMLVSLYFGVLATTANEWHLSAISGFFAGSAFLIKQPGVGVAIAIVAVLGWNREYRKAIAFVAGAAVPVVAMLAVLLWREPYFLTQFTQVGKGVWSLREGIDYTAHKLLLDYDSIVRLVPLCIGIAGFAKAVKQDQSRQMIAWFALISLAVGLSGLPQLGAVYNYFLPAWAGCAMLLPVAVEAMQLRRRPGATTVIAALILVCATWLGTVDCRMFFDYYQAPKNMSYEALRPYRMISDISTLSLYGHDPDLVDSFAAHSMELKGRWSSAPIVENIRRENYDLILLPRVQYDRIITHYRGVSDYAPAVVAALNQNYVVLCNTMRSMVLKPRDREIALTPAYFSEMFDFPCGTGRANKSPRLAVFEDYPIPPYRLRDLQAIITGTLTH